MAVTTTQVRVNPSTGAVVFGSEDTDNSWRIKIVSGECVVQRRIAGTFTTQLTFPQPNLSQEFTMATFTVENQTQTINPSPGPTPSPTSRIYGLVSTTVCNGINREHPPGGPFTEFCIPAAGDTTNSTIFLLGGWRYMIEFSINILLNGTLYADFQIATSDSLSGTYTVVGSIGGVVPATRGGEWVGFEPAIAGLNINTSKYVRVYLVGGDQILNYSTALVVSQLGEYIS
jgi:hypothetical protein